MSLLDKLQADLHRAVIDHQATLLVQVLRQRSAELTFGDLRQILNSRLGQGLADLRVHEMLGDASPAAGASPRVEPAASPAKKAAKKAGLSTPSASSIAKNASRTARRAAKRAGKKAAKKASKTKTKAAAAKPAAKPAGAPPPTPPVVSALSMAGREQYDGSILQFLREHGDWQASGFVRAHVGGSAGQIRSAMERLEATGAIVSKGRFGATRYQLKS